MRKDGRILRRHFWRRWNDRLLKIPVNNNDPRAVKAAA